MIRWFLGFVLFFSFSPRSFAQYPGYFNYTIENGGPSNEVYSILEDKQGYIWIGCDAGLYRYNGVRFEQFSSPLLSSRAVTGLCQTTTGTIYAYNFNGQILTFHNEKLTVLKGWDHPVNSLAADSKNNIWVSTGKGLYCISDKTKKWHEIKDRFSKSSHPIKYYLNSVRVQKNGIVSYIEEGNIVELYNNQKQVHVINLEKSLVPVYITEGMQNPWVFRMVDGIFFVPKKGKYVPGYDPKLTELLKFRKITNAQKIEDDIWISTYSGIVKYNIKKKTTSLFYPQKAFSSCLKDREGNYWFTTLHDGILRMPSLEIYCWNSRTGVTNFDQFSHVVATNGGLCFASTDGVVGEMRNTFTDFYSPTNTLKSDIGAMYFDPIERCVFYNKMNSIFRFCDGKSTLVNEFARPIKDFHRIQGAYLLATSQGTYLYSLPNEGLKEQKCILQDWSRAIVDSPFDDHLFIAGNNGLYEFSVAKKQFKRIRTYFNNRQVRAMCTDEKKIYLLTFDGMVYSLEKGGKIRLLFQFSEAYRVNQISENNGKLYFATNMGMLVFDLKTQQKWVINNFHGLCSNNIKSIAFTKNHCWLATGNGLHRLPLTGINTLHVKGKIILRRLIVNGKEVNQRDLQQLDYRDNLSILVDGLSYRSNGHFNFAYRFVGDKSDWIKVPATIDELSIPRLPIGAREIEIKLIDHENRDSENVLRFSLNVKPPFYQRWWFYVGVLLSILGFSYLFFKKRIQQLQKKQDQRLQQLRLENELRLTQQIALKAQMNHHFLFNVLNSIKGYIYENDKKNAAKYLNDFSNFVRKVLDLSALPTTTLADELEIVKLYINLESMLLQDDFTFEMNIENTIDAGAISIPSLLLQPYVENAFKHGLRHKKGKKKLIIAVTLIENEEVISIQISDNGIGRKAADIINRRNSEQHVSFATSATQKRIELLNFEKKGTIGVVVQDNFSSNGEVLGTSVIIRIHLSYSK